MIIAIVIPVLLPLIGAVMSAGTGVHLVALPRHHPGRGDAVRCAAAAHSCSFVIGQERSSQLLAPSELRSEQICAEAYHRSVVAIDNVAGFVAEISFVADIVSVQLVVFSFQHALPRAAPRTCLHPQGADNISSSISIEHQDQRPQMKGDWIVPVSYTHLTLPTNREV